MTDQPTPEDDVDVDVDEPAGPPAGSPLFSIRTAASEVPVEDDEDTVDLAVPRWEEVLGVHVRYHRVSHRAARKILDVPEKKRRQDPHGWDLTAAAQLLIAMCTGIFVVVNGAEYAFNDDDPSGSWPTFDDLDVLRANLPGQADRIVTPADAVKALYLADADILTASAKVSEAMGYDLDVDLERIQGN